MGGFNPNTLVFHDYGGTPANSPGMFNPYHALVFPDGSLRYRNPQDPYGAKAPHAYRLNPQAIGLSYAGQVGSQPTPAAMETLRNEAQRIGEMFPGIRPMSHGEAYAATRGTPLQASKDGRDLDEASWRTNLVYGPPAPGQSDPTALAAVPKQNRSLTSFAGLQPDQPSPAPAQPARMSLGGPMPAPQQQNPQDAGNGFLDHLATRMQSPLFQGGMGMLVAANQGRDAASAMAQGMQTGMAGQKMNREMQRQKIMDDLWNDPNFWKSSAVSALPPELVDVARRLPPDQGGQILGNYVSRRKDVDQMGEIARQNADIELKKADQMARQKQERLFEMIDKIKGQGAGRGPSALPMPQAGAIEDGYRFKGGNPADPNSWEKQ